MEVPLEAEGRKRAGKPDKSLMDRPQGCCDFALIGLTGCDRLRVLEAATRHGSQASVASHSERSIAPRPRRTRSVGRTMVRVRRELLGLLDICAYPPIIRKRRGGALRDPK
jgi:hypothetical protein